ncbi:alpha/beta hydrolase [Gordonibacter sp. An230]|nr:alpha/beta hydrolase [Gordonibacter sp. An230]
MAIVLVALVVAAALAVAAFLVYASDYYRDADAAHENLVSTPQLPVTQGAHYLAFGDHAAETGLVFYPGAKVEYTAYAPLMRDLAARGYLAVVVEMPFNFAFFGINAADEVRETFPQVREWWIGGHSLGGSMAAQYAADHADDGALAGLVLLGAYTASDLSASDLGALVVYGSEDQVLNRGKLADSAALMPEGARTIEIVGGNHAGFGAYGPQEGDGTATISAEEQREQTIDAVDSYIASRAT